MRHDTKKGIHGSILIFALGVASCIDGTPPGAHQVEEKSSPITNGYATTAHQEVGSFIFGPTGEHCSATLIGNSEIMTAAHCIAVPRETTGSFSVPGFEQQDFSSTITFRVDDTNLDCSGSCQGVPPCDGTIDVTCCDTSMLSSATPSGACAQDYEVTRLFPFGTDLGTNDIAIGHLSESPWQATPVPLATTEPSNTNLYVMGYGCIGSGQHDYGIKRYAQYYFSGQSTWYYCFGDSGGPTFTGVITDTNSPIARVASGTSGWPYYNDIGADPIINNSAITTMVAAMDGTGISYRPQMQSLGFRTNTASNGAQIGSTTQGLRMEAVQVWSPESAVIPMYQAYVQNSGWQGYVQDGVLAGTAGQGLRMEAFEMFLEFSGQWTDVKYRAWVHGATSWQPWINGNDQCTQNSNCLTNLCAPDHHCAVGTTGQSKSIEALEIQVFH